MGSFKAAVKVSKYICVKHIRLRIHLESHTLFPVSNDDTPS